MFLMKTSSNIITVKFNSGKWLNRLVDYPFEYVTRNRNKTNRPVMFIQVLSSFLCTGTKLAFFFHIPFFNTSSNIMFKGIVTDSLQILIILINNLSCQCDFLESKDFIIGNISLFATRKEPTLMLVLYKRGDNTLLFS